MEFLRRVECSTLILLSSDADYLTGHWIGSRAMIGQWTMRTCLIFKHLTVFTFGRRKSLVCYGFQWVLIMHSMCSDFEGNVDNISVISMIPSNVNYHLHYGVSNFWLMSVGGCIIVGGVRFWARQTNLQGDITCLRSSRIPFSCPWYFNASEDKLRRVWRKLLRVVHSIMM